MVDATLLPFEFGAGVTATRRTPSSSAGSSPSAGFADAMDGALGAERQSRRTDHASRSSSHRPEPARPAATSTRPAAKKNDRADEAAAEEAVTENAAGASGEAQSAERSESSSAETTADAAGKAGDAAEAVAVEAAAEERLADCGSTPLLAGGDGEGDAAGAEEEESPARGRRWATPAAERASEQSETAPNGAARRAGAVSQAIRQARSDAGVAHGGEMGQIAQEAVASMHDDAGAGLVAANAPITQAVETATATAQTASTADVVTALENAVSAVETAAGVEPSAGTDASGAETQDQTPPKPQAPNTQANAGAAVATGGPADGVRFTVSSAAGNAAYTSAAPRTEEAVLPQIVKSIRLHAAQGTTEARVQLKPEHLGALNITLKVEQNQVTATIQADAAAVRQWIQSNEASLRQALSEQGLHLAELIVHPDGEQASGGERNGDTPRREPRRRSWRDEEQTFEVLV